MTLVDSSVWFDHFHKPLAVLDALTATRQVLMHPYVFGEIAMGRWKRRTETLIQLRRLKPIAIAGQDEVLRFVEQQELYGSGIGFIDVHLLASVRITPACSFLTRDKRLRAAAIKIGIDAPLI